MNYTIIENFLPLDDSDKIENTLMSNEFPWFYVNSIGSEEDNKRFYFSHIFYHNNLINSSYFYNLISPIIYYFEKNNFKINKLIRVKGNLFVKENKNFKSFNHVDAEEKHFVLLYYANTNNGYTLLNDKVKIPSIKNTAVVFDGSIQHRAVSQTDTKIRTNININYL